MKRGDFAFLLSLVTIFTSSVVSAQETNFQRTLEVGFDSIASLLTAVKLDPTNLSIILLGVLLFVVIYSIVKQIFSFEGRWAWASSGIISLIIVILTFIYLPENFIEAITLQYSAVGVTILAIIPFIILLYFTTVVSKSLFLSRAIWVFYTIYYFILFGFRAFETPFESWPQWVAINLPFFGAIAAGVAVLIYVNSFRKKAFESKIDDQVEKATRDIRVREAGRKAEKDDAESRGITG